MSFEQRYYQEEATDHALDVMPKGEIPILSSPTGSGKTLIELWIAKWFIERGKRANILTPREEILKQFIEHADSILGPCQTGVVKSGYPRSPYAPLQLCSWPTLRSMAVRAARQKRDLDTVLPTADVTIIDEAHLSVSPQMGGLVLPFFMKNGLMCGATATPASPRGLGSVYTSIKHVTSIRQLIKEGYLVPLEYWGGAQVDLRDVRMRSGDYVAKDLGRSVTRLVGDYVDNWLRLASDRHTIVFTPDQASCEGVTERYNQAGIKALALHSAKHPERREAIVDAFKRQDAQVLVNVGIASFGFDCPSVNCIQLLRNTKSIVLHLQQLGRGMRIFEGKDECMVLDHTQNVKELGYADDLFRWRLAPGKNAAYNWSRDTRSGETKEGETPEPHVCRNCDYMFERRLDCPKCGLEIIPAKRDLDTNNAKLVRISAARTGQHAEELELPQGRTLFRQLLHIQERRGYKSRWAVRIYKDIHPQNYWPAKAWNDDEPEPPCHALLNQVNKRNRDFRKGRKAVERRASA